MQIIWKRGMTHLCKPFSSKDMPIFKNQWKIQDGRRILPFYWSNYKNIILIDFLICKSCRKVVWVMSVSPLVPKIYQFFKIDEKSKMATVFCSLWKTFNDASPELCWFYIKTPCMNRICNKNHIYYQTSCCGCYQD